MQVNVSEPLKNGNLRVEVVLDDRERRGLDCVGFYTFRFPRDRGWFVTSEAGFNGAHPRSDGGFEAGGKFVDGRWVGWINAIGDPETGRAAIAEPKLALFALRTAINATIHAGTDYLETLG